MAQFTVNARRFDPYKNFKFRLKWDGRYIAGVSKVSASAVCADIDRRVSQRRCHARNAASHHRQQSTARRGSAGGCGRLVARRRLNR